MPIVPFIVILIVALCGYFLDAVISIATSIFAAEIEDIVRNLTVPQIWLVVILILLAVMLSAWGAWKQAGRVADSGQSERPMQQLDISSDIDELSEAECVDYASIGRSFDEQAVVANSSQNPKAQIGASTEEEQSLLLALRNTAQIAEFTRKLNGK